MSDNRRPLLSFTVFPTLPFELRCLIWETSCESRIVEITYDSEEGFLSKAGGPPIALQVCQESRNHLLTKYPLCFGSIYHPAKIRFNFSIDTLYLDNTIEEEMAHVFSTFREQEISSLKYLAIDNFYGNTPIEDDLDPYEGLKRAVKSLKGLKQLLVVFHVEFLSTRVIGCGGDHDLSLFEKLPTPLENPRFELPLLHKLSVGDYESWELDVSPRPVYGWRRCPDNDDLLTASPQTFFGEDYDSDDDSDRGFMGGIPFPIALGMGLFNPDYDYSDMDDDDDEDEDEDDEDEETTDDEMPDLGSDTDDEMPGLGSASEDNEHRSEAAGLD